MGSLVRLDNECGGDLLLGFTWEREVGERTEAVVVFATRVATERGSFA